MCVCACVCVCVCRPVSGKDQPWGDGSIDSLQMLLQKLILLGALSEIMLRAHQYKVDAAIVKTIPAKIGQKHIKMCCLVPRCRGATSDNIKNSDNNTSESDIHAWFVKKNGAHEILLPMMLG